MNQRNKNEINLIKYIDELKTYHEAIINELKAAITYEQKLKHYELKKMEFDVKSSIRWRIGSLIIVNLKKGVNFFKNPLRYLKDAQYRKVESSIKYLKPPPLPTKPTAVFAKPPEEPIIQSNDFEDNIKLNEVAKITPIQATPSNNKPTLGVILDEFSMACLEPECNMITFRADNWKEILESNPPQALFIESAWHGNNGSWQYRIAKYQKNMGDELINLINWARKMNIPSIFWNKEDPPNFDRFIEKAKLFDIIFTSDENCIENYRQQVKHNNIFSLPFAAQPLIHNPLMKSHREFSVCFAGTYHADEYNERQRDMEVLLKPSIDFGLHIYDRNFGSVARGSERFRFPEIYQPLIKGRLDYNDMVKAYQMYKVFLNVNSVKNSPTMFSRRVFELLACGTPVISTFSKGIEDLLGDTVFLTESEEDTRKHLDYLLGDADNWEKASVRGIRKVLERHTYDARLQQVLQKAGLKSSDRFWPSICVFSAITSTNQLIALANTIIRQTNKPSSVVLFTEDPINSNLLQEFRNRLSDIPVYNFEFAQNQIHKQIGDVIDTDYYVIIHPNDFYGNEYLKDYLLSTLYSSATCRGRTAYRQFAGGKITLQNNGTQFKMNHSILLNTLFFSKKYLSSFNPFYLLNKGQLQNSFVTDFLSVDSFNYILNEDQAMIPGHLLTYIHT